MGWNYCVLSNKYICHICAFILRLTVYLNPSCWSYQGNTYVGNVFNSNDTCICKVSGVNSIYRRCLTHIGISIMKIRRSHDWLIVMIRIPLQVRRRIYIEWSTGIWIVIFHNVCLVLICINISVHFLSFLNNRKAQVVEIRPRGRQVLVYLTQSTPWMLMAWWRYWPAYPGILHFGTRGVNGLTYIRIHV